MMGTDRDELASVHKPRAEIEYEEALPQTESVPAFEPIPEPAPELSPESELPPSPVIASDKGIPLIVDDVGYDLHALKRILDLSVPVAISVLPGAPFASQSASLAHQQDQIVMLHLPMEPIVPKYQSQMTDAFLRAGMSESELRQTFLQDLANVPYVEGVNNHMGSRLTQLERPMSWVMRICREKGLFFVDSRTSSESVAAKLASSMGVAWASRRYFLDHQLDEQAMEQAWDNVRGCAAKGYRCIVIAHPHEETISFLEKHLTKNDMGHMLPVSHLLRLVPLRLE
jgi:polysaccharide deacetylase 2 family uncharacterized protein YibQ